MCGGIDASGTSRRFSRPVGASAVMSGAPSVRSASFDAPPITSIRSMTAGSASFAFFPPKVMRTCWSLTGPSFGTSTSVSRPMANSPPCSAAGRLE